MHGHDADFIAPTLFKVTLDLGITGHQPMQEPLQGRGMIGLIPHGKVEELINRVVGLNPQPPDQARPDTTGILAPPAQQFGKQFKRTFVIDPPQPFEQKSISARKW